MQVDHPCAETYSGGWSAGFSSQGREGPSGGGTVARGPAGVAPTLKTAGAFLFLLPGGRPRWLGGEGAAAAAEAGFFPLPFGRPGFRFSGMPASPEAPAARGDEGAAAAAEAGFFLLPFGRPGFRFFGMPVSPKAPATWGAKEEGAAAAAVAFAVRASKVLLLRLPFGRPRFRDTEGAAPGASTSLWPPSGTLTLLAAEPLGDDMTGLISVRRSSELREK
jgi:hypothetical protein